MIESGSAVQGIDSGLGVCDVELLDVSDLAQTGDLAIDRIEFAGGLKLALPGVFIITGHIVVSVVTGNGLKDVQSGIRASGEPMLVPPDMDALLSAFAQRRIAP